MFDKEKNSKAVNIEINNIRLYKRYNNILITPFFMLMLNNFYEDKKMDEHLGYDFRVTNYNIKCFERTKKKQYNSIIVNLYKNGKIVIDNNSYMLKDFYIVYKNNKKKFYLICVDNNYSNDKIDYDKAVKLIDTTAFINLINNNEIKDNSIVLKNNDELLNVVNSWDGLLHEKVAETDVILNKNMIGNDEYE